MARVHRVERAQQRYEMVPKLDCFGNPVRTPVLRADGSPKLTKRGKEITREATVRDLTRPLPNEHCGKCGVEIKPGEPYKWVATKSGPYGGQRRVRCDACPTWRQSELTSSKMAGVYAAQEQLDDEIENCEDVESLESLRDDLAEQIGSVADEYEESANNIVDGFGHETYQSEELQQKAEDLRGWADDISSTSFEDFGGEDSCVECDGQGEIEDPDDDSDEPRMIDCEECGGTGEADNSDERETWIAEQRDLLIDIMQNCPV